MEYCPDAVPLCLTRVGNEVESVEASGSVITIPAGSYLAIPMSAPFYGTLPGGILPPSTGDGYFAGKERAFSESKTHRKVFVMDPQDSCHLKIESVWSLAVGSQNNSGEYTSAAEAHKSNLGLTHSSDIVETSTDAACSDKQTHKLDTADRSQTVEVSSKLPVTCNTSGATTSSTAQSNVVKEAETQTSLPSSAFQSATCTQSLSFLCCRQEFSSEELFFAHLKEVHGEGFVAGSDFEGNQPQSYTCETCGQVFSEERLYSLHGQIVKISSSQLKDMLGIILEGQGEGRKASFADNEPSKKRVQPPKGSYDCYYCAPLRTYYLYSAFSRHLENIHKVPPLNEQGKPQCQVCVEEFPDSSTLYEHIEHHHVRKATNVFNECVENVRSRTDSGLEMKCVFCQRLFTKERLYFVHLKGHFVKKENTSSKKRRWKLAPENLPTEVAKQPETVPTEVDSRKAIEDDVKTEEDSIEVKDEPEKEESSSQNQEGHKKKKKKSKEKKKLLKRKHRSSVLEPKTECVPAEKEMKERISKKMRKMKRKHKAESEEGGYTGRYSFVKSLIKASNEEDADKMKATDNIRTSSKVIQSKSGRLIKRKYPRAEVASSTEGKSSVVSTEANLEKDCGKGFGEKPPRGRPRKNTRLKSPTSKQQKTTDETETLAVNAETVLDSNDVHLPDENQAQKRKRSKNEKELSFHCCGKSFKDETGFFSHLQSSHQQFQHAAEYVSGPCSVCGQNFPSLGQLLFHTNLHEALKSVGLPDKLQQPTESVTKSEVQSPESNKPVGYFICQMCRSSAAKDSTRAQSAGQSRTYSTFWAFSFHMQKAHNVPFVNEEGKPQCQYCSESFGSEGECYRHISTSHPKFMRAPTSTFSQQVEDCLGQEGDNRCVLCGREFLKRRVRQIHLKKHFSWE